MIDRRMMILLNYYIYYFRSVCITLPRRTKSVPTYHLYMANHQLLCFCFHNNFELRSEVENCKRISSARKTRNIPNSCHINCLGWKVLQNKILFLQPFLNTYVMNQKIGPSIYFVQNSENHVTND